MIVFVHGVPETAAVWDAVRASIARPSVALSLPGFGCPRPDGFAAGMDDYLAWLVAELGAFDEPIDLVGHDWGALLVYGVVGRAQLPVRSWAADVGAVAHPDYVWHAFAQVWQAPGDGEAFFDAQLSMPASDRAGAYQAMGVPEGEALAMASSADRVMGECILDLYRSAVPNIHARWGPWRPSAAPGRVVHPTEDPFDDHARASATAAMFGARVEPIDGVGHFWPYEAPDAAAALLESLWSSLA